MTPAPDTGRTADENEMREAIARMIEPEAFSIVDTGNADPKGWAIPLVGGARHTADRILSGPLAPILQEAATARKERDEAQTSLEECAALVSEYAAAAIPDGMEILAKDRDKWFDAAQAAEQEAATLRARLQEAERALKPFAALSFSFDGFGCDPATLVFQHREYGQWRSDHHCAFDAMIKAARAALATPVQQTQEAGDHEPR